MKRVRLNVKLMEQLFEIAAVPVLETLSAAGIAQSSLWGWMDAEKSGDGKRMRQGGIPVLALVELCNVMRIPARKLFVEEEGADIIPSRGELVSLRSRYIPCSFNLDIFRKSFGIRSEARMSVTSMLKKLGVSYTVYVAWIADAKNLRIQSLLDICNEFGYDFFRFVVDDNSIPDNKEETRPVVYQNERETAQLKRENTGLLRELESTEKELKEALKEKEILEKENAALKIENSELVYEIRRLKDRLQLLTEGAAGMVAESAGVHPK